MVVLVLAPLVVGVVSGYALGGRLRALAGARLHATWLLWLGAGLQFFYFHWQGPRLALESRLGLSLMVPIFGLIGAWVLVNLPRRPRAVQVAASTILFGGLLNATVIAANGRMPYSESAVRVVDGSAADRASALKSLKYAVAGQQTRLSWLGDVIPVGPLHKVISVGDIVLLLGVGALIAATMRAGTVRRGPGSARVDFAVAEHQVAGARRRDRAKGRGQLNHGVVDEDELRGECGA